MSNLLLSKSEQGIVVFHVWKSLKYKTRLGLSILLILAGFVMQYYMLNFLPGVILVLAGNILLLVKGYDTRIKLDSFKPDAEWVKTDAKQLSEIELMNKKIKRWDISALEVSSTPGCFIFVVTVALLIAFIVIRPFPDEIMWIIIANIVVLILPHWFTGLKQISTTPELLTKIKLFQKLLDNTQKELEGESVNFLTLVSEKSKFPTDVKMKINFTDQPEDFLGYYAQISMNNVQGTKYPYFYTVLVAKEKSKLLSNRFDSIEVPDNVIKEFQTESDIEIVVIRQYTTKQSGYHTKDKAVFNIFNTGLKVVKMMLNKQVQ
jgi:hypothetical protein